MKAKETKLDLQKYLPTLSDADVAFSVLGTDRNLLVEATERGFDYSSNPYHKMVDTIFFSGGKLKYKEGIDEEYRKRALRYFKALISSFAPKHEDKTAICAMILSEIAEPELA